jgi:hypothetical protein
VLASHVGKYRSMPATHLDVYFGSQRIALAVVSLFAIVSGEGGLVAVRGVVDTEEDSAVVVVVATAVAGPSGGVCGAVLAGISVPYEKGPAG